MAIKNLFKLAPFAGVPWNLPHKFHLYLIDKINIFFPVGCSGSRVSCFLDFWESLPKVSVRNIKFMLTLQTFFLLGSHLRLGQWKDDPVVGWLHHFVVITHLPATQQQPSRYSFGHLDLVNWITLQNTPKYNFNSYTDLRNRLFLFWKTHFKCCIILSQSNFKVFCVSNLFFMLKLFKLGEPFLS